MYHEIDLEKIDLNSAPPTEEPDRQYYYMAKCREWVKNFQQKNGHLPKSFVVNMGCQMNARDSEKLAGILENMGYEKGDSEEADFVIYNTCTVRENANNKVYGRLGYLHGFKKKNPHMKIALCGCMMQEREVVEKLKKSYSFVDLIFGTHNIYKFAELLWEVLESGSRVIDVWEETDKIVEELPVERKYSFKSGVNIMFGCNNFCSYCIVPYVRGRERSRNPKDIIQEIEKLAEDGVVEEVHKIQGIERIRFMTSHPKDLSDELIEVMKNSPKVCRHLHLPLQSGSTRILREMNRRYTKDQYLALVEKVRRAMPDISITTDIIVGFPGETEEDFLETLDVVKRVRFDSAFTFIYSKRTGTPAAAMEGQIPEDVVKDRFDRLLKEVQSIAAEKAMEHKGKVLPVLVEGINEQDDSLVTGRLSNNSVVHLPGGKDLIGTIQNVELTECKGFYYMGRIIS